MAPLLRKLIQVTAIDYSMKETLFKVKDWFNHHYRVDRMKQACYFSSN